MAPPTSATLPTGDASAGLSEGNIALAREVVVDSKRAVVGYGWAQETPPATRNDPQLFNLLRDAQPEGPTSSKTTFIPCTFEHMADGCLRMLDPQRTVLEIAGLSRKTPEGIAIRQSMLAYAQASGFRLAFDHSVLEPEYASWLPLASYVRLDLKALGEGDAEDLARRVISQTRAGAMASHVTTDAQYERMKGAGATLFEGLWYAKPPTRNDNNILTSQASVLKLIGLVTHDAEVDEIEDLLKRDPALSFKLLHFINSPGFGLNVEITSFRHAVMTIGLNGLFRWAVLLLTATRPGGAAPAAGTLAVVRGRVMELLAAGTLSRKECDTAFVVGVFSMLDTLVGLSLEQAMRLVNLPAEVEQAILHHEGPFAPYLLLARACEAGVDASQPGARHALGLSDDRINKIHLQALAWADQLES